MLAAQTWASIEDQEGVAEAVRLDQAGDVAAALKGWVVEGAESSDSEEEDDDDDEDGGMGGGGAEPLPYEELSQHFASLGNYLLKRGRMLMIGAHASKPSRQADAREEFY